MDAYKLSNDSVLGFIQEYGKESIENESVSSVYTAYELFCANNGLKPTSQVMMSKKIKTTLGLTVRRNRIANKLHTVYVHEEC